MSSPKKGRGRPKKKAPELPQLKTEDEIRDYLMNSALELTLHLKDSATKSNNIKNPQITRAKTNQYKLALQAIEVTSGLLKDKQDIEIQRRLGLLESVLQIAKLENPNSELKFSRKGIPPKLRVSVLDRDDYRCQICGKTLEDGVTLEVDHKIPVAKGGTNDLDNLHTLCSECNIGKSARLDLKCTREAIQATLIDELGGGK